MGVVRLGGGSCSGMGRDGIRFVGRGSVLGRLRSRSFMIPVLKSNS